MSLIVKELQKVWEAMRASMPQRRDMLHEVRIRNFRGIRDLRVPFGYPVSVLAGPNGCGKSTVLFACACAYRVPGRGPREFVPSSLFPNFTDRQGGLLSDSTAQAASHAGTAAHRPAATVASHRRFPQPRGIG